MKGIVFGVMWLTHELLNTVGEAIFSPLVPYPRLELVLIMVVIPVIMNSFQYWITDSFLKKRETTAKNDEPLLREIEMDANSIN